MCWPSGSCRSCCTAPCRRAAGRGRGDRATGAGKSTRAAVLKPALDRRGGAAWVASDQYKPLHPAYRVLLGAGRPGCAGRGAPGRAALAAGCRGRGPAAAL
ncbi:hypothetical protein GXW82_43995 [Streptacidiphilus sp. 4-A2]|nr:hypothetical protein [Streptacidiphilus sp. 4-A2]